MKKACMLDSCAAAATPAADVDSAEALNDANTGFRFMSAVPLPGWFQGTLAVVLVGLFVGGVAVGVPSRRRRHRLYELASLDENTERESSRTVRMNFGAASGPGTFTAPLMERLRVTAASAASALVVASSSAAPASWEDDEEALLQPVAFEHDPI